MVKSNKERCDKMTELKEYSPFDKRLAVHGRTARGEGLELFWTGSGVEMQTDATELYFELRAGFGRSPARAESALSGASRRSAAWSGSSGRASAPRETRIRS